MYSTRNLISNGGFSRTPSDPLWGWSLIQDSQRDTQFCRIAVPDADRNGVPHSAYAAVLRCAESAPNITLAQRIPIAEVPTRRFALRLAARCAGEQNAATLTISVGGADARGGFELSRHVLALSLDWQRHRIEFKVPEWTVQVAIEIALVNQPGDGVEITDVRLVGLLREIEDIAVRFDTSRDLNRASSRLRAFMIEDYLNLLGCRTSLNQGRDFDLYVCQKVMPWARLARAKITGKPVVFDLDDNDFIVSRTRSATLRIFSKLANGVSVGSKFLREMMEPLNSRIFLLENPVDVLDQDVMRDDRPWGDRLVWFGMPENLWMLTQLGLDRTVATITRGGSIEYALKTVDTELVAADLALLPVSLNDETLAKNANRLVKCVGLGLPFLASDTAEHRRAMRVLALPDDYLVASGQDWSSRIDAMARDYPRYRRLIADARPRAFEAYGVETIVAGWFPFCAELCARRD